MRIVLITQDDVFFLPDTIERLVSNLPDNHEIVASVCLDPSPFGKKQSMLLKARRTLEIFGVRFFLYYSIQYIYKKYIIRDSVVRRLKKLNIKIIDINTSINSPESLERLSNSRPDILISLAGNEIFKKQLISLAPMGCLNVHTALLPEYRGLMPSFWVLLNNEEKTGVSVFFVDEGIDSGPIIKQRKVEIDTNVQDKLIRKTKTIGVDLVIDAIDDIANNRVKLIDNPDCDSSYFSFPKREDVKKFYNLGKRFF
jgi:methionyl-tRNA formyltransferase